MLYEEKIAYLNEAKKYLNLTAVCKLYNYKHSNDSIDYNNLRTVINRTESTRLSEKKIDSFISFIQNDLIEIFHPNCTNNNRTDKNNIEILLARYTNELTDIILEEISNGIQNKQKLKL